jgi:hypothetical protein
MSRWADWVAINTDEMTGLQHALEEGDDSLEAMVRELLGAYDHRAVGTSHVQMDKAWEPIRRCLTGDHSCELDFDAGETPLKLCVLGGRPLLFEHGYRTATMLEAHEAKLVASALSTITQQVLHDKFYLLPSKGFFHEINEAVFEWVYEHFELLKSFFTTAARSNLAVLCTISH